MEILERKLPANKVWRTDVVCSGNGNGGNGCGSLLRVGRDDIRYFAEQEFPWRIVPEAVVMKCPVCDVMTDILKTQWPHDHRSLKAWSGAWRDGKEAQTSSEERE